MAQQQAPHFRVAIVGSGFGGLGMAIRLEQAGEQDFVILERAGDVGGVWRDNTYPGCACDVQSHLYSFSFAPNPDWSRAYSGAAEIHAYLRDCAQRFGLQPHLRLGAEVREARWEEGAQRWRVETAGGTLTAQVLVSAAGALSDPAIPALPGLERFRGKVMHSARWDWSHELRGRQVAVVGTGASAIQFVPRIQPQVAKLVLLQRTAPWVLPHLDHAIPAFMRRLYRALPLAQKLVRGLIYAARELMALGFLHPRLMQRAQKLALRHLARSVPDPVLREKLTPHYTLGCKRVLLSNDYLPALTQPNVEVVTAGLRELREHSLVTADGREHPVDTLILGTGFQVTDPPIAHHVRGRDGRTLAQTWAGSMRAYAGTTVAGFPNFFMLPGPNTGLGHTSMVTMLESQFEHVLGALRYLEARGLAAVEPRADAQARYVSEVDARMRHTVWAQGGCHSWYLDATGRNSTLWPGFTFSFRRRVASFEPSDYLALPQAREARRG
ncbi:MAG TPA: NAD(P)/FAD-dependent oxidoreductase [Aggregicoccus sp.]|nr:NAD(P)/FAD-dependent oxidoreductase [Aggregicoccus sp.]